MKENEKFKINLKRYIKYKITVTCKTINLGLSEESLCVCVFKEWGLRLLSCVRVNWISVKQQWLGLRKGNGSFSFTSLFEDLLCPLGWDAELCQGWKWKRHCQETDSLHINTHTHTQRKRESLIFLSLPLERYKLYLRAQFICGQCK